MSLSTEFRSHRTVPALLGSSPRARDAYSTRLRASACALERKEEKRGGERRVRTAQSRESLCVVVPTRHQHNNPDDKGERVAGVRGQPGPVAGVRPISGRQPAGHRREIVREKSTTTTTIVFCLCGYEDAESELPNRGFFYFPLHFSERDILSSKSSLPKSVFLDDNSTNDSISHRRAIRGELASAIISRREVTLPCYKRNARCFEMNLNSRLYAPKSSLSLVVVHIQYT